ncbi:MAG: YetF domain-containing protein [Acidimicrobiales bacterium]
MISDGQVNRAGLRRGHLTEADLHMVLREHGISDPAGAKLVGLEARGAFSVVPMPPDHGEDPT